MTPQAKPSRRWPRKLRLRLALLVLVVGLPLYLALALYLISLFERPSIWLEFVIYAVCGILWIAPLRRLFLGLGQAEERPPSP